MSGMLALPGMESGRNRGVCCSGKTRIISRQSDGTNDTTSAIALPVHPLSALTGGLWSKAEVLIHTTEHVPIHHLVAFAGQARMLPGTWEPVCFDRSATCGLCPQRIDLNRWLRYGGSRQCDPSMLLQVVAATSVYPVIRPRWCAMILEGGVMEAADTHESRPYVRLASNLTARNAMLDVTFEDRWFHHDRTWCLCTEMPETSKNSFRSSCCCYWLIV